MSDKQYIDIKIVDGGWEIDDGQQPTTCSDTYSIAQDVKHAIMESGLARELQAERNPTLRAHVLLQIEEVAENDSRIIPGTATVTDSITDSTTGAIELTAQSYDGTDTVSTEVNS